jgi:imidazolonepropionase-like amidohydrolase
MPSSSLLRDVSGLMPRRLFAMLATALLAACAVDPPALRAQFAVRQAPYTPDSGSIAIRCGRLIDGAIPAAHDGSIVVIRNGRIVAVERDSGRAAAAAALVPVLDLRDYTCLPGLIDMHTHLTDNPEDTADLRVYFSRSPEDTLLQSQENAAATLRAGFTTVRNVGTYVAGGDLLLRESINRGNVPGPRMQVSGPYLTIPQGGGDLHVPGFNEPEDNARFHFGVARPNSRSAPRSCSPVARTC